MPNRTGLHVLGTLGVGLTGNVSLGEGGGAVSTVGVALRAPSGLCTYARVLPGPCWFLLVLAGPRCSKSKNGSNPVYESACEIDSSNHLALCPRKSVHFESYAWGAPAGSCPGSPCSGGLNPSSPRPAS